MVKRWKLKLRTLDDLQEMVEEGEAGFLPPAEEEGPFWVPLEGRAEHMAERALILYPLRSWSPPTKEEATQGGELPVTGRNSSRGWVAVCLGCTGEDTYSMKATSLITWPFLFNPKAREMFPTSTEGLEGGCALLPHPGCGWRLSMGAQEVSVPL